MNMRKLIIRSLLIGSVTLSALSSFSALADSNSNKSLLFFQRHSRDAFQLFDQVKQQAVGAIEYNYIMLTPEGSLDYLAFTKNQKIYEIKNKMQNQVQGQTAQKIIWEEMFGNIGDKTAFVSGRTIIATNGERHYRDGQKCERCATGRYIYNPAYHLAKENINKAGLLSLLSPHYYYAFIIKAVKGRGNAQEQAEQSGLELVFTRHDPDYSLTNALVSDYSSPAMLSRFSSEVYFAGYMTRGTEKDRNTLFIFNDNPNFYKPEYKGLRNKLPVIGKNAFSALSTLLKASFGKDLKIEFKQEVKIPVRVQTGDQDEKTSKKKHRGLIRKAIHLLF